MTRTPETSERRLTRVQALSGLVFLLFVVVHLVNAGTAAFGAEAYNGFQRGARSVYQITAVEILLVMLPLVVHVVCAIVRIRRSGFRRPGQGWRMRLHRYTGYFMLLVVFGHIVAVRGPSVLEGFYPEFEGLSFSLWWMPWMFYPYYLTFAFSGLYHGANGAILGLAAFGRPMPVVLSRGWGFWLPVVAGSLVLMLGILGMGGVLYDVGDPTDNDYARMWEGLLGVEFGD